MRRLSDKRRNVLAEVGKGTVASTWKVSGTGRGPVLTIAGAKPTPTERRILADFERDGLISVPPLPEEDGMSVTYTLTSTGRAHLT